MTSMNIQTANDSIVEAIKAIVALDPETILSYDDDGYLDEFDLEMRSFLKKERSKWSFY